MSVLNVQNLSHGFGDRAIFNDVSFRLLKGEHVGLVGANGEGKSTFMNIVTGKLQPDEGKVEWSRKVRVGYLDQHAVLQKGTTMRDALSTAFQYLFDAESEINELYAKMGDEGADIDALLAEVGELQETLDSNDFYQINSKVEEVARGLGLDDVGLDRDVDDLSGGQRTKVLLAKLLLEKPEILLLDEPTNYLDVEHIRWLTSYLKEYPYAFILISHDTEFMNPVSNVIFQLEFSKLTRYTASYEKFLELAEINKNQHINAYEKQMEFIKKQEDFIAKNKARYSTTGRAKSRQKQLDRLERIDRPETAVKPTFGFKESRSSSRYVFEATDLEIGYTQPLLPKMSMTLERGEKVAIIGCNGVGKSTLLKTMLGKIDPINGKVERGDFLFPSYFEQEVKAENMTPIDDVWNAFPSMDQHQVRAALARCGL
ncbi:ABC-F family ATP-binding cassette domain-containing protein, partial [Robertmurraya sp.]|uniref:ABC-F family ATP-binding cassette domain-containing protein n=1 Tax=Robertmurraya sp. TaxID=2837525 RepID=UPI0037038B0B